MSVLLNSGALWWANQPFGSSFLVRLLSWPQKENLPFFFLLIFPFCPFVCLGPYLSWYLKGGQKETLAISRELQFRTVLLGEPHILTVAHRAERRSWRFPSRQRHARMQKELDSGKLPKK